MSKPYTRLIPAGTDDVWEIHDVDHLTVLGLKDEIDDDRQEFIVVDPGLRRIMTTGGCFGHGAFGSAILRAIEVSETEAAQRRAKAREKPVASR